ncbi:coiled-coil domain-containing protein [Metabacillus fastidiosus]|uniref:coiled-coil domain-containing protein n=1 Tax=Metabacillus fastidiosus TaxID=1458 RepID=UPI0012E8DFEC|nr:hypothetical protein [Metabacillus fastidiosus]
MKKSIFASIGLSCLLILWPTNVYGEGVNDLENKQLDIIEKTKSNQQDIHLVRNKVENIKQEKDKIDQEIKRLDETVFNINKEIKEKEAAMSIMEKNIYSHEKKLNEVDLRIDMRTELLKKRARSLQENGSITNYLNVMLDSQSIGNLVNRINAIATILKADKELLQDYKEDRELKEQIEEQLRDRMDFNKENLMELRKLQQELQLNLTEKSTLMKTMSEEEVQLVKEFQDLEDESLLLKAQEGAIKQEIENAQREAEEPLHNEIQSAPIEKQEIHL